MSFDLYEVNVLDVCYFFSKSSVYGENMIFCVCLDIYIYKKVSKGAKIRNQYNQVPHLTQDTNGKVTNSQLYTTNKSQEVSRFPAGDHKF